MKGARPAASSSADGDSAPAAVLWKAAADAMAWRASIRDHAARRERKKARAAMAEADGELSRAAEACGRVVDAQDRVDTEALGRAMAATKVAAEMLSLAFKALARSSRLHRKAGAGLKRASKAYGRAADPKRVADVRKRAARAYADGRVSAGIAASVRRDAKTIARDAGRVEACMAEWASAAGGEDARPSVGAEMRKLARPMGTESDGIEENLEEAVRTAAEVRKVFAESARRSAAGAAKAVSEQGDDSGGPDVQRAEAAWRKALAAANRADADWG